jgi:hypothetical protein
MKILVRTATVVALTLAPLSGTLAAGEQATIKVQGSPAVLQGAQTVAIGAFNVGFVFESLDQTKDVGGVIGAVSGASRARSELIGVSPETMQAVVDAAHADLTARLAAAGYVVQDPAVMFGSPGIAKAKAMGNPQEIKIQLEKKSTGKATYYKPTALPRQLMMLEDFTGSGMSSIGANMAASQGGFWMTDYAKKSGVPVIDVTYLVDFSDQKRPGGLTLAGINVNANISVVPVYSKMTIISSSGKKVVFELRRQLSVDGDFADRQEGGQAGNTVTSGLKVASALSRGLFGTPDFAGAKTRKVTFTARPDAYREGAAKAAELANEAIVSALAGSR